MKKEKKELHVQVANFLVDKPDTVNSIDEF